MTLSVRLATPEDAAAALDVHMAVAAERRWIATTPEDGRTVEEMAERFRAQSRETGASLVAVDDGRIVGLCGVRRPRHASSAHTADVGISVAASHRGRGVGRALMEAAEAWARAAGVQKTCLGVFADNERARRLYVALGYQEEGLRRGQYVVGGERKDEVLMGKWL